MCKVRTCFSLELEQHWVKCGLWPYLESDHLPMPSQLPFLVNISIMLQVWCLQSSTCRAREWYIWKGSFVPLNRKIETHETPSQWNEIPVQAHKLHPFQQFHCILVKNELQHIFSCFLLLSFSFSFSFSFSIPQNILRKSKSWYAHLLDEEDSLFGTHKLELCYCAWEEPSIPL